MKILRADNSSIELFKNQGRSFWRDEKKKTKAKEFKSILEQTIGEFNEDVEEFKILLPKHGHFWDNGYEDLD